PKPVTAASVAGHRVADARQICGVQLYPRIDREVLELEVGRVADEDIAVGVRPECFRNLPGLEGDAAALCRSVVAADDVVGVAITGPPTDHARWWRHARSANAGDRGAR